MKAEIEVWNLLHDGEITVAEKDNGILRLFVSIPYLRRRIKPLEDSFILTIHGLTSERYQDYEGKESSILEELEVVTALTILSTESLTLPITIDLVSGKLILEYSHLEISLDTGGNIPYFLLEKTCEEYWDEWQKRTEQGGAANPLPSSAPGDC